MSSPVSPATPANPSRRRLRQLAVSVVVGGVCLWFAFRGVKDGAAGQHVSLETLADVLRRVPTSAYLGYLLLFGVQVLLRVERWRLQVRGLTGKTPSWGDAMTINALAYAAVFFLPFRLGEFVRPNLCASRGIMSASAGLAATALERIIDGLVATAMFGALLLLAPFEWPPWVRAGGVSALVFFGSAIVALLVAMKARGFALRVVHRLVGFVSAGLANRIGALVGGFLDGLRCFRGPGDVLVYLALSIAFWVVNGISTAVMVIGVDPEATWIAGFVCLCFLVIGVMVPAPPGNVGNFHAFAKLGLTVSGVATLPAIAAAVLLHALSSVTVAALAAAFAAFGTVRWQEARHALDRGDSPAATGTGAAEGAVS